MADAQGAAAVAGNPHQVFRGIRYFDTLDGLRALAILFVIGHHALGSDSRVFGYPIHFALFFAISGFLITTLLLREREKYGDISPRRFFIRRAIRLYPLYYAVLAMYVLLVWTLERGTEPGAAFWRNLPAYLTFTANWFVSLEADRVIFYFAWSLAAQEQFYLVWPWIVKKARRRWVPAAFLAVVFAVDLLLEKLIGAGTLRMGGTAARIVTSPSAPILVGCALAYALHWAQGFNAVYAVLGRRWSLPAAFVAMSAAYALQVPNPWMTLLIAAVVGAGCIRPDAGLKTALSNRVLAYLGTISYGLYLMHMLAINVTRRLPLSGWGMYVAAVAISIVAASVSYRYFELPLQVLKDRLAGRRPAPAGWQNPAGPAVVPAATAGPGGDSPAAA
jgi:peptidoglycan/LPS O-acetylase OafA/YrhL